MDVITFALCKKMTRVNEVKEITKIVESLQEDIEEIKKDLSDNVEASPLELDYVTLD